MKRLLTTAALLVSLHSLSQPVRTYEERRNLDSIAKANVNQIFSSSQRDGIFTYQPIERFKVTASAQLNTNVFSNGLSNLTTNDILSFGAYDIRARFYITPTFKIFQRVFITGTGKTNYFFTTGFIKRF
jgi:hypothetical protein